jgi:hypothetical protein
MPSESTTPSGQNPAPEYPGERYEAEVPDTLDLAERAQIALNGLGGTIDPDCHHTMFFNVQYSCQPPFMRHHGSADVTCDPKFAESFPMMRVMCGSDLYADLEAAHRAELLSRLSPDDGLYYNLAHPGRPWRATYNPAFDGGATDEDLANLGGCGRMLRTLVTWREREGDGSLEDSLRALVRGLARLAIYRDDYAYYPNGGVGEPFNYPRSGWLRTDEPQSEVEGGEGTVVGYHGHQIQGLMRWVALSGDPEALDLAAKLTRFCVLPRFWGGVADPEGDTSGLVGHVAAGRPDPPGLAGDEQGHWYTHFHARAIGLRGILEYARVVQDARLLEFVRRAYEFTLSMGIPRLGWVNCYPGRNPVVEGCALGDLVALGIRLSDAGVGDYWDDVDAVVRNHLVEQQLVRADLLEQISEASEARRPDQQPSYPKQETSQDVIGRSLGNFAGVSTPADICRPWVMQCCTGNGTQGLYYAWEGSVRGDGDTAQVNLLLNRASPWLDVDSDLPYEGKVSIRLKTARRLAVRIPSWVPRGPLRSEVNGTAREGTWIGNYLTFLDLRPGDRVVLQFPVPESTARYTVAAHIPGQEATYTLTFRGSAVVEVSPRDTSPTTYPLYLRDHLRAGPAPRKRVGRFVAERMMQRW